ncbi:ribbon-helix-helix protein, CopG family [Rhizorhabdus sp.]|jgi:hypothetical protein|uniref:ribbon-helix-helix protein, CopG family n=1 Tax=Rhizorhabdus sp. TaxID=1968843 RepID=UPI0019A71C93|nr:ribbon-helix-helix protein, CopG family [Rhizorhabdus sp.]
MRRQTHDTVLTFRAPAAIVARAESTARERGMSFSEFLRQAVRRELTREAA